MRLEPSPAGLALSHDGKLLVVADDAYVVFVDTASLVAGRNALLGYLQDTQGDPEDNDAEFVYAAITPDDRYALVSDESNQTITVIDLATRRSAGQIDVGNAPVAIRFSRDGRYAFTTSQVARRRDKWPFTCVPEGSPPGTAPQDPAGEIITVDMQKAAVTPTSSAVSQIPADCHPVRMDLSPDGGTAWVTNRESGSVTAFDTAKLIAGDKTARVATIPVGSNPVAIAVTNDGKYVLAANTNRFGEGGTSSASTVSVIDAQARKVIGTMTVGSFPREFSHGSGDTLFLSNNRSNSLTEFNTALLEQVIQR